MQVRSEDLTLHTFIPSDGSESAAVKVVHRQTGTTASDDSSPSQIANLRHAIKRLIQVMNPSPGQIVAPEFVLFDHVRVQLPQTFHDGLITDITWDYTRGEWKFFATCTEHKVTNWYVAADLSLEEEI